MIDMACCEAYLCVKLCQDFVEGELEAMKNRIVSFALALLAILSLTLGTSLAAPPRYKVAYLINGALGDLSFYDSGQEGIDRIKKELNAETRTIECNYDPVAYPQALQSVVAWGADVIFVVSYGFEDLLMQYADMYPEKKWINLDTVVQNKKNTSPMLTSSRKRALSWPASLPDWSRLTRPYRA